MDKWGRDPGCSLPLSSGTRRHNATRVRVTRDPEERPPFAVARPKLEHRSHQEADGAGPGRVSRTLGGAPALRRPFGSPMALTGVSGRRRASLRPWRSSQRQRSRSLRVRTRRWCGDVSPRPPALAPHGLGRNFLYARRGRHVPAADSLRYGSLSGSRRAVRFLPWPGLLASLHAQPRASWRQVLPALQEGQQPHPGPALTPTRD